MPTMDERYRRDYAQSKVNFNEIESLLLDSYFGGEPSKFLAVDIREVYLAHVRRELRKREKARG